MPDLQPLSDGSTEETVFLQKPLNPLESLHTIHPLLQQRMPDADRTILPVGNNGGRRTLGDGRYYTSVSVGGYLYHSLECYRLSVPGSEVWYGACTLLRSVIG